MGTVKLSLSNILFSKVRQTLLALLYTNPSKSFHSNEIIRLTDSETGSVQHELEKLNFAGLINVKMIDNQKHYSANPHSSIFFELRSIILKTFGLADVIKQALFPIASHIYFAFIYDSIAKQEDHAISDINLMIITNTLSYANLLNTSQKQLGHSINPTIYSKSE